MRPSAPLKLVLTAVALLTAVSAIAAPLAPASAKIAARANRLLCKTGSETRAASQPLELYLQYHLPVIIEAEDPTVPFGRQVMVLQGRPLMDLHFKKASEPAGENGEKLEPMTCAFANRVVRANEPSHVQILLPTGQTHWLTQNIGQRPGPKQLSFERAVMQPAGDWAFASQFDRVFYVDIDDMKSFVTTQLPK